MKARTALALFLSGTSLFIGGVLFKIQHWPFASIQLILGAGLQSITLIVLAYKVARAPDLKGFLDR